jgi:6-phosphogluconate dehydrogenase
MAYLQGFELLRAASAAWEWDLSLPEIAELWRGGSILRANLLEPLSAALEGPAPLADPWLRDALLAALPGWRRVVVGATAAGLPAPVLAAGLGYLDALGRARLPTAMIQAQRDRFGDHGFARVDEPGAHHGPWSRSEEEDA